MPEEKFSIMRCVEKKYIADEFIGKVISDVRTPTQSQEFNVGFYSNNNLELGQVISVVDGPNESVIYGLIDEIFMFEDVPEYSQKMMECNWDFQEENAIQRQILAYARVKLLRRFSENSDYDYALLGVTPNLPCYKIGELGLIQAFDLPKEGVPLGIYALSSGQIVKNAIIKVSPEYLLGKEAAHVNISGQSGFGKSAYMLYLLKAIYASVTDKRIKTVIFNVKEDDLLWLDKENPELDKESKDNPSVEKKDEELYTMLGVPMTPFDKVVFYATEREEKGRFVTASLRKAVKLFHWQWEDVKNSIQFAIGPHEEWDDKMLLCLNITRNRDDIQSFSKAIEYAESARDEKIKAKGHKASWGKYARIIEGIKQANEGLLRQSQPIPYEKIFKENDILVIDINEAFFQEYTQRLIFGKVLKDLEYLHQQKKLNADFLLIITDELSRYASKSADTNLIKVREIISGIAARGRSIQIPLIGLEQFPSDLDEKILGNVNTKIFTRTKESELKNALYKTYSKRVKFEMVNLKKGYLFAENSQFPDLIKLRFPRPPCAQKYKEPSGTSSASPEEEEPTAAEEPEAGSLKEKMDSLLE